VGWIGLCETQLDRYNPCGCWVLWFNPTYEMIAYQSISYQLISSRAG